eukprot:3404-Prymnesium_polylepis.1
MSQHRLCTPPNPVPSRARPCRAHTLPFLAHPETCRQRKRSTGSCPHLVDGNLQEEQTGHCWARAHTRMGRGGVENCCWRTGSAIARALRAFKWHAFPLWTDKTSRLAGATDVRVVSSSGCEHASQSIFCFHSRTCNLTTRRFGSLCGKLTANVGRVADTRPVAEMPGDTRTGALSARLAHGGSIASTRARLRCGRAKRARVTERTNVATRIAGEPTHRRVRSIRTRFRRRASNRAESPRAALDRFCGCWRAMKACASGGFG